MHTPPELWLALVMIELADRDELLPEQLAAILATTLDERMRPNAYIGYQTSDTVLEVHWQSDESSPRLASPRLASPRLGLT